MTFAGPLNSFPRNPTSLMSEAATLRPRPKPRPCPVTIQSYGSCDPSALTTGSLTFDGIDNSDNQFVVNRGRTKETWRKLDEINKSTDFSLLHHTTVILNML